MITRAHNAGSPFFELSGIELALRLPLDYPERRLWRTQGRQILKRIQIQTTQPELLPALAGMWFGQAIRQRISAATFKLCFFAGLLALGGYLVARTML